MRILAAFLGVALLGGVLGRNKIGKGQEIIGPIDWNCTGNGAFPYPEACELYVDCWEGTGLLGRCTDIMLFDLSYNGCNYAQQVHCGDRPRPPTYPPTVYPPGDSTTTVEPPPPGDFNCTADGVFPHPDFCEYYFECYIGVARMVKCNLDYLYDLNYDGCNFPEYTHCGDRARPIGVKPTLYPSAGTTVGTTPGTGPTTTPDPDATTPPTTSEKPGFVCPSPEGDFADPDDCTKYYVCVANQPIHAQCPDGLFFNPDLDICDYPANVDCTNRTNHL